MSSDIVVLRYGAEDKTMWNDFVKHSKTPMFMFDRDYMDYHSDRFQDHSLMFYNKNKLIAVMPANQKGETIISHGGLTYGGFIVGNDAKQHTLLDSFAALIDYARITGIHMIEYKTIPHIYHLQPAEEDRYALFRYGARIAEVCASTTIVMTTPIKMTKGRRAQVNRARREGVTIERFEDRNHYVRFMSLENNVLNKRHNTKAVHTQEEMYRLHERFPENIILYGAEYNGELIAGSIVYVYKNSLHTQYMAADETARKIGALDLLVSTIISDYNKSKIWLDFGISTENEGKYLNEGLISQKEGFGGRTIVYEKWTLEL